MFKISRKTLNDFHIALSFTVLFTAYNGQSHVQQTLTVSIQQDNPDYEADGYICFGILFSFFTFSLWLVPSAIALIGWKGSIVLGSLCYIPLVTFGYFEKSWVTYVGGAITGFGAALLWTSQATYCVLNSENGNVYKSISVFCMFCETSEFTGNLFVYCLFKDPDQPINRQMRNKISLVLAGLVSFAALMLCSVGQPIRPQHRDAGGTTVCLEMKKVFRLLTSKHMLLSSVIFIFCGLNFSFLSVLPACLGFTRYLSSNSKEYAPLSGVMHGCGEFIGTALALCMRGRSLMKLRLVPITCMYTMVGYIIVYLGLPNTSVFTYTSEKPIVEMPVHLFLLANIFVGMADACMHIEAYNFIGQMYPVDCAPAFAVFKFIRNIAISSNFYYSRFLGLHIQMTIMIIFSWATFAVYYCSWEIWTSTPTNKIENDESENVSKS